MSTGDVPSTWSSDRINEFQDWNSNNPRYYWDYHINPNNQKMDEFKYTPEVPMFPCSKHLPSFGHTECIECKLEVLEEELKIAMIIIDSIHSSQSKFDITARELIDIHKELSRIASLI